jgi:hypothetical protein
MFIKSLLGAAVFCLFASSSVALDARALPVKWSGKSFCAKSTKLQTKAIVGTLTASSSKDLMVVIEIRGLQGSSTLKLKLKGDQLSGVSSNDVRLAGRVSPSLKKMTMSSNVREHDLLTCILALKAK